MKIQIVPYDQHYDEEIHKLEQDAVQGKSIQLEIIKDHFLDRAVVFKKYHALLAVDSTDKPIATGVGARTCMIVNGNRFDAGYGYEVKVGADYRNKGVGRMIAKSIYKTFFGPEGLIKNFTTLKKSNIPIVRLLGKAIPNLWLYDFVYMTIPCQTRLTVRKADKKDKQLFGVTLFTEDNPGSSYYCLKDSGLGYFNTFNMYRLKIKRISWPFKTGLRMLKIFQPGKFSLLPVPGKILRFAALFNHDSGNIHHINEILEELEKKGVHYLMICCRKNDGIFNRLKKFSVNTYGYYLLTDFPLSGKDAVTIDVRCL